MDDFAPNVFALYGSLQTDMSQLQQLASPEAQAIEEYSIRFVEQFQAMKAHFDGQELAAQAAVNQQRTSAEAEIRIVQDKIHALQNEMAHRQQTLKQLQREYANDAKEREKEYAEALRTNLLKASSFAVSFTSYKASPIYLPVPQNIVARSALILFSL